MRCDLMIGGLDVIVTGSQKGLMIPPGLAFATLSERAKKMMETSKLPKFYFSFKKALKAHEDNDTPFTPAITLVVGLEKALRMIREETVEHIWHHHKVLSEAVRNGCEAIGLKLFGAPASHAVTAVNVPDGVEYSKFNKILKQKYGITTAGGQEHLKGKIFRVSHLGYYDEIDIVGVVAALEWTLHDLNFKFEPGSGVTAVQKTFAEYESRNSRGGEMKVLITDPIEQVCTDILQKDGIQVDAKPGLPPDEIKKIIGSYDGLIVRSGTKVTADIIAEANGMKVIGRAGAGVDNIDVPAATRKGIVVIEHARRQHNFDRRAYHGTYDVTGEKYSSGFSRASEREMGAKKIHGYRAI